MGDQQPSIPASSKWTMERVLPMFAHMTRWKILFFLIGKPPQPASAIPGFQSIKGRNNLLKHLAAMCKAGMLIQTENRADRRQCLYSVSPELPVIQTEQGPILEFGYFSFKLFNAHFGSMEKPAAKQEASAVARPKPVITVEQRLADLENLIRQLAEKK